jgi:TolB-like protein/Tfp pilus assembly protein PilF
MSSHSQSVAPAVVLEVLDRIVASPSFGKAERPGRLLRFLVEKAIREESSQLKESVIGVEFFGRPADWDPRLDSIVRQEASRLRKRLARYYDAEGANAAVRIDLPVGSYMPSFVYFPESPESPEATAPREGQPLVETRVIPPLANRKRWFVAVAILCAAAAGLAVARHWHSTSPLEPGTPNSIAVLPFLNVSPDPSNQYFADGLTDEITDQLARNKSLRVVARSSASQFKAKAGDIGEVGRKLNVQNIVEGSVERAGDRIRIIAHLERASDGFYLWSNTYERQTSDLFAAQSELAAAIAGNLKAASGLPGPVKHTPKAEAFDWTMKGRYESHQGTPQALARAEADFLRATEIDPQYAAAYAALAALKFSQAPVRVGVRTGTERQQCEQFARKALQLDPELSGPRVTLAYLAMQYDWDWIEAEKELRLALSANPDASVDTAFAMYLIFRGRFAEADPYLRRAQDLDPFGVATLNNIANARYMEGRLTERYDIARKLMLISPDMLAAQLGSAAADAAEGHTDEAWSKFQKLKERAPAAANMAEAWVRSSLGQREQSLRLIRPYEDQYPTAGIPAEGFALVYAHLGDEPNTVKWLHRSIDAREWQALNLAINPAFHAMENSSAFLAMKGRMGLR